MSLNPTNNFGMNRTSFGMNQSAGSNISKNANSMNQRCIYIPERDPRVPFPGRVPDRDPDRPKRPSDMIPTIYYD